MRKEFFAVITCALLIGVFTGCQKEETAIEEENNDDTVTQCYFIDTSGRTLSKVYEYGNESPENFDEYGIARVYLDNEDGAYTYFIDEDYNVLGNKTFKSEMVQNYYYEGKDVFIAGSADSIVIYDESMNTISSLPYDLHKVGKIYEVVGAPGANGLIPLKDSKSGLWGYINFDGTVVIDFAYKSASTFSADGVAIVRAENGLEGVIDENGKYVIEPMYLNMSHFDSGRAFAESEKDGGFTLIDNDGQTITEGPFLIPPHGALESIYNDGLACVQDSKTKKYGYINIDGDYVIEPKFASADDFTDGLARVEDSDSGLYGYIDTEGNYVIEPKYKELGRFVDGYARVMNKEGLAGAIDIHGKEIISCEYEDVTDACDGIFGIKTEGLYGYYSVDKGWIIEPKFTSASSFKNGFALVMTEDAQSN